MGIHGGKGTPRRTRSTKRHVKKGGGTYTVIVVSRHLLLGTRVGVCDSEFDNVD